MKYFIVTNKKLLVCNKSIRFDSHVANLMRNFDAGEFMYCYKNHAVNSRQYSLTVPNQYFVVSVRICHLTRILTVIPEVPQYIQK